MPDLSPDAPPADALSAGGDVSSAETRPEREYDANGHYVHGPRLLAPPLVRLIGERILRGVEIAPREKAPAAERRKMGRVATRTERARRLIAGQFAPARRRAS
jgi:hypothetical protein